MMSLRQIARTLPRASSKLCAPVSRRTLTGLSRPSQVAALWKAAPVCRAAFSTAVPRLDEQSGSIDHELSAKLESELQLEAEAQETPDNELPDHLSSFLKHSQWKLVDTPGTEEVTLTKRFGKETIKVVFSISDISEFEHDPDAFAEDPAMYDEDAQSMQQGGAQSKGTINQGRTKDGNINVAPEDRIAPADREELADDESADIPPPEGFPARLQVTITKEGSQGAMFIESTVRDGEILTENVHYFASAELAEMKTADQDWARRSLYTGPPFANLDEDLQALIDQYTAERGIDVGLAQWIPEYMDYKEQREYVSWLQATKNFIDA